MDSVLSFFLNVAYVYVIYTNQYISANYVK